VSGTQFESLSAVKDILAQVLHLEDRSVGPAGQRLAEMRLDHLGHHDVVIALIGGAGQGVSVSLSADGSTAIVGGAIDNANVGAAWVYSRKGGVWSQQGDKLVGTGAIGRALQGVYVALSGDGNTVLVGGREDDSTAGAAWVFVRLTKDDCKNGGWLNFIGPPGPFTNQGQCVRYFAKQQ
jgi:hypothetical protein